MPPPPPIVLMKTTAQVLLSVKTMTVTNNLCDVYKNTILSRAYRAAIGGKRACNDYSVHIDGESLNVTKNSTSAHPCEDECTNGKWINTVEYGPL